MSQAEYLITLDVGTTAVKAALFERGLNRAAFSSEEYQLLTPRKDIVELDPRRYRDACCRGIRALLNSSGVSSERVKALILTTQGETLIPVDQAGNPLSNAMVWLDSRAGGEAEWLSKVLPAQEYYSHTGLPETGPANPLCKVLWLKNQEPEIFRATNMFLLLEDYLLFQLTGRFASEQSLLSSAGYFDINEGCYWQKALDLIGVPVERFPDIHPCGSDLGPLNIEVARELGLLPSTRVLTGAMDQISSALAAGNFQPGIVSETTGAALIIAASTEHPDYTSPRKVSIYRHYRPGLFLIIPYCPTAGIILKWFKDEFCPLESQESSRLGREVYSLLDRMADEVAVGAEGLILLPHFSGTLNPDLNLSAKGVFYGIGLQTRKAHFLRAILESVGYMLRENIELLESMGISIHQIRSQGGGARSTLWNSIKADINNKPIVVGAQEESASLGAAMLGALALGWYKNPAEAHAQISREERVFAPDPARVGLYEKPYQTYKKLYAALQPVFGEPH
jgi:xylulokinase